MKRILLFIFLGACLIFTSCKKTEVPIHTITFNVEKPTLRVDKFFPNGVLQFNSTASIKSFWDKVVDDRYYANKIFHNFTALQNSFDDFKSKNSFNNAASTAKSSPTIQNPAVDPSFLELIYDENNTTLPDETLGGVLNANMQVVVNDTVFQFTRIGVFKVAADHMVEFTAMIVANREKILYDANFTAISNEISLGDNQFQVQPGIIRQAGVTNDIFRKITYINDGGGTGNGSPGFIPPNDNYYVNAGVNDKDNFNKEVGIIFNDWAKRRFVFKTQNLNIAIFGWGFHKIDIKAKMQREKKVLWVTYWGESYADDLIVGCDNMNLETDYIFPFPQDFTTAARPTFEGLSDFEVGNNVVKTLNIKANISALGYSLNSSQLASFISSQFNSLVGNTYNNIFKGIENNVLNSIDPNYLSRYAAYTKKINTLKDDHKLKWAIGKAEKIQGYSHDNTWRFDWNIGGTIVSQGGGVGGYPLKYNYKYDMKGGSFFGRARVGNVWHGIRIIKI